jgi:hypothetical protein
LETFLEAHALYGAVWQAFQAQRAGAQYRRLMS